MKKIAVLGAGLIGETIAKELSRDYDVTAVDINDENLNKFKNSNVSAAKADVSNSKELQNAIQDNDLVIGAVPGFLGFQMLKNVIKAGKNIVDISFCPEDPLKLDKLAKDNKVTAIIDFGVAPGMDNVLLGYHDKKMKVENFVCMVGGLPVVRRRPFEYKAPFSPADVLEEYNRPARLKINGNIIEKPALSDCELVEFDECGTLEAFNTDGLRTLLSTMPHIPNMKEMTMRYPGHADLMRVFREIGFFDKKPIPFNGKEIIPLEFTSALLFPKWKADKNEDEFTAMRVIIEGVEAGKNKQYIYNLFDRNDTKKGISSMARTTGYACMAAAELLLSGKFNHKGVFAPEQIGAEENCFNFIMDYLKGKNIEYKKS